jgi:hypothetical protein
MTDYSKILFYKYAGSYWTLNGDDYEGLTWLSDTSKPSKATLDALWPEVQDLIAAKAQAKIDAKTSAQAKLAALGLSLEDLQALGL